MTHFQYWGLGLSLGYGFDFGGFSL